jgi:hypothetical protein
MRNPSFALATCLGLAAGCGSGIDSDEEARRAYLGLDVSIEKSLILGFDGFNAASSANIDPQATVGNVTGTLTISGQVDKGQSMNKEMRLRVGMIRYSDGYLVIDDEETDILIVYDTSTDTTMQPYLQLSLRDYPNGTFTGTLTGVYRMTGSLEGDAMVNLTLSGMTEEDGVGTGKVKRKLGTTTITGTASTGDGSYEVDLTL